MYQEQFRLLWIAFVGGAKQTARQCLPIFKFDFITAGSNACARKRHMTVEAEQKW